MSNARPVARATTLICACFGMAMAASAADAVHPVKLSRAQIAGDSVVIPEDWTGVWDTEGYTKIYVIYSPDGPITE
jgi:hypothetical protein